MSGNHASLPISAHVRGLEQKLIEAGLTTDAELDSVVSEFLANASPTNGARLVARAWTDAGFRTRLLDDANAALPDLDLSMQAGLQLQDLTVVANTEDSHNMLVCTLCSCYPVGLLGPPPSWYKYESYRSRVVREPRAVLAEFGLHLDDHVEITVWDSSAESRYMVLPRRPAGTEGMTEPELAALVTREGLIGTAAV